ncbi:PepSY domain-containing protein [Qipengyuania sediminis]|uniref:PepSY domain-containing protein n=1 Tax=Qipengyuania sediminis TaxID=1532023 RepID=UPI00105A98BF|nr:PepSY domain-containing protein [Qipengyuania sediminis]
MDSFINRFARWHVWLGWLAGVPLLFWTLSGLVMVARPIEEVRGEHLRREHVHSPLPAGSEIAIRLPEGGKPVVSTSTEVEQGRVITRLTYADESVERYDAEGRKLAPFSDVEARMLVAREIVGGDRVASVRLTDADAPPIDFRRPVTAWQVVLADGTHVYVARDTGEIAAVRTRWWRVFDWFWGLHIMDLETREDTHHPLLIGFAALSLVSTLLGLVLLFRRRKPRASP